MEGFQEAIKIGQIVKYHIAYKIKTVNQNDKCSRLTKREHFFN
jgi:hypothetical protein